MSAGVTLPLSGATRLIAIIGDPIAQVKSPAGVTQELVARGCNVAVVPLHVAPDAFDAVMHSLAKVQNLDGIIATVPHKFAAFTHCATTSPQAQLPGAANILRRNTDGGWHGDMLDGKGFVAGIHRAGCMTQDKRALLAGAGGAGSAIALALLEAGVAQLAIHDADAARRDTLIARLASRYPGKVVPGSNDPQGFDVIANATPMGMRAGDPYPVNVARLAPAMFVGDVITVPEVSPLLAAARARGCATQTGVGMFREVQGLMIAFLLAAGRLRA